MRIRSILSLAVSAVAAMALATPAQAADDGSYFIRDVRGGACLAGGNGPLGGHVEPCNPGTVWEIRNQGNGLARIVEARGEGRCLALSPLRIYPCGGVGGPVRQPARPVVDPGNGRRRARRHRPRPGRVRFLVHAGRPCGPAPRAPPPVDPAAARLVVCTFRDRARGLSSGPGHVSVGAHW